MARTRRLSAERQRFEQGLEPRDLVRYRVQAERTRMKTALLRLRKAREAGVEVDDLFAPNRSWRPAHHRTVNL